ncbi:unnamed protein product [Protopolystoma xenopodis]|uniref:Tubulin-folding cofactor D C-terminal domain-containing protein n=1 Tax=Protopolystoma xenopodis TaxID=117903 RepID=A0A3S5A4Y4_9PLAT|nr:unnamed protein product [Protopolystoma xenopodis]
MTVSCILSECEVLNWMSAEVTFNYFVQLLDIPEFSYSLMLGLLVSVGGLTEKTARCSSESLRNQLRKHEGDLEYMKNFIRTIDHIFSNQDGERVALPLLKFTDFILNEPAVTFTLLNEE